MAHSPGRERASRAAVAALIGSVLFGSLAQPAHGQSSQTAHTVSTMVSGVFGFELALPPLTQNSQTGNLCSPGACFVGTVSARGNRGWKLQVKLASPPAGFTVRFVQTTVPPSAQAVNSGVQTLLTTGTWLTVASSSSATAGSAIGLMFNANKTSGNTGVSPNASMVAAVVMYQVVAFP